MKLFKTILLSTTLLMSVPFASGVVDDSSAASPARDNAIAETGKRFLAYKTKTASTLLNVLTRDAGASIPEGIVLSADSNDVDVMKAIAATLKALTAKLKAMEATAQDATTTIQTLTEEQAAAAEALAAVRKELAAVIEAKTAVDEQLLTATGRVETLEAELAALKAGATEADGIARAKITGLEEALVAAQGEVTALTERAATADNVIETQRAAEKTLQAALLAEMDAGMDAMDGI
jgi:chromosome segregation ATPase